MRISTTGTPRAISVRPSLFQKIGFAFGRWIGVQQRQPQSDGGLSPETQLAWIAGYHQAINELASLVDASLGTESGTSRPVPAKDLN